jgi:hypothetical protein
MELHFTLLFRSPEAGGGYHIFGKFVKSYRFLSHLQRKIRLGMQNITSILTSYGHVKHTGTHEAIRTSNAFLTSVSDEGRRSCDRKMGRDGGWVVPEPVGTQ